MRARTTVARIGKVRGKTRISIDGYYFDGNDLWVIQKDDHGNSKMIKEKDLTQPSK